MLTFSHLKTAGPGDTTMPLSRSSPNAPLTWRMNLNPPGDAVNLSDDDKNWQGGALGMPALGLTEGQSEEEVMAEIQSLDRRIHILTTQRNDYIAALKRMRH